MNPLIKLCFFHNFTHGHTVQLYFKVFTWNKPFKLFLWNGIIRFYGNVTCCYGTCLMYLRKMLKYHYLTAELA